MNSCGGRSRAGWSRTPSDCGGLSRAGCSCMASDCGGLSRAGCSCTAHDCGAAEMRRCVIRTTRLQDTLAGADIACAVLPSAAAADAPGAASSWRDVCMQFQGLPLWARRLGLHQTAMGRRRLCASAGIGGEGGGGGAPGWRSVTWRTGCAAAATAAGSAERRRPASAAAGSAQPSRPATRPVNVACFERKVRQPGPCLRGPSPAQWLRAMPFGCASQACPSKDRPSLTV